MDVNLVLFRNDGRRKAFPLPSNITVIGRQSDCDLYAPLRSVSKRHCQLNWDQGVLRLRDLGSRNGTYLNGKRVGEAEIQAGDHLKIGSLTFVFQIGGKPEDVASGGLLGQDSPQEQISIDELMADDLDELAEPGDSNWPDEQSPS